jgi:hypothetical protein
MFSQIEKKYIAAKIEELLLSINHPEMPKSKPSFTLHVDGAESWSFADIVPNWTFEITKTPSGVNPWNEQSHETIAAAIPAVTAFVNAPKN